ncbi:MAG: carboxypeptidase-like regulatory domain-containing protein [Phycisphaerae bacterium]|nr:carboxypeptidase-like regulatory domain-containing protein [Phycisphaerae bacterium]
MIRRTTTIVMVATLMVVISASISRAEKPYAPPICPHILGWPDDVKKWAEGAPWIKALDITSCGIAKERGARVFYRVWDHASGPDGDPKIGGKEFGQEILDRLKHLPKEKWPDAISFQNEFNDVSPETARCFIDMYDTLRKGGYEGLIVFGSYGPGGPTDSKEWERPHVKEACLKADAIETHEYWDLTVKHYDTWLAHRHVRAMNDYPWLRTKPWFIGEFGSDGVNKGEDPQKRSGWRDRDKLTADEYIRQIEIYRHGDPNNEVVAPAENVMAVFLFQQGAPPHMWQGWETRGTKVMDYMKSTWKPTHGFVTGKVTNSRGEPVEGVQIAVSPSDKKATTDAKGIYWLFAVRPGNCVLKATKTGFRAGSEKLSLKPGDIRKVDISLASQPTR